MQLQHYTAYRLCCWSYRAGRCYTSSHTISWSGLWCNLLMLQRQSGVRAESCIVILACMQVLTPLQYARALVYSGPHNIDGLAIATCLYEELFVQNLTCYEDIQRLAAGCPAVRAQALLDCR